MNFFKFNWTVFLFALGMLVLGMVLALVTFGALGFDVSQLISHFGTWYAPITFS